MTLPERQEIGIDAVLAAATALSLGRDPMIKLQIKVKNGIRHYEITVPDDEGDTILVAECLRGSFDYLTARGRRKTIVSVFSKDGWLIIDADGKRCHATVENQNADLFSK